MNDTITKEELYGHRNVPVKLAAKYLGVSQEFIRCGLIRGVLPFGSGFKIDNSSRYVFQISPTALVNYYENGHSGQKE